MGKYVSETRPKIEMVPMCSSSHWFPYDEGPDDFGYREWWCRLPRGHEGDHMTWPGREDFARMTPRQVNAWFESVGLDVRVCE